MSTPTTLQTVYNLFLSKSDEDFTGKESLIFQWLNSAISKCKKYVRNSLDYTLDTPIVPAIVSYDGSFVNTLEDDEIELIAMQMQYENYNKKESYLVSLKTRIGTKDFNSLPSKKQELDGIQNSKNLLKEDIKELQQEFNTYKYS